MNRPSPAPPSRLLLLACVLLPFAVHAAAPAPTPWRAGVATRKLNPPGPVWLAGYANRTAPSAGLDLDLHAKALSLDDGDGGRLVLITLDLIGITAELRAHVEREGATRFGLRPHEILLNASHTHSGPLVDPARMLVEQVFRRSARPEDVAATEAFAASLRVTVVELLGASLAAGAPARLEFAQARAGFAMNRRRPEPGGVISNNPHPAGPVDHDVPVLRVAGADGKTRALVFGYACHNTTLSGNLLSGDYAGHAQRDLEEAYPGATALFITGAGGDQNPYPRRGVPGQTSEQLARQHGRALANAVHTALAARPRPVTGPLRAALAPALLDYDPLPPPALAAYTPATHTPEVVARAKALAAAHTRGERPPPLPCAVHVVRLGSDLTLLAIAGEVVVDYALRLKRELAGPAAVWIAGYSNEVFGYLPSRRVLAEGGYEAVGANTRLLIHPGPFAPDAEDRVVAQARTLLHSLQP